MADVLAGLGGVKLKTVERSPGGTIIRNANPAPSTEKLDPAAMIAAVCHVARRNLARAPSACVLWGRAGPSEAGSSRGAPRAISAAAYGTCEAAARRANTICGWPHRARARGPILVAC